MQYKITEHEIGSGSGELPCVVVEDISDYQQALNELDSIIKKRHTDSLGRWPDYLSELRKEPGSSKYFAFRGYFYSLVCTFDDSSRCS